MPTHYESLLFCSMSSYRESRYLEALSENDKRTHKKREKKLLASDWKPLESSEDLSIGKQHGYYGVAYYKLNKTDKTAKIVIAHRGTCFDELGNIIADIDILGKREPRILREAALQYTTKLFAGSNFYDTHPDAAPIKSFAIDGCSVTSITHTGFSLGGYIAGACAGLSRSPMMRAFSFDGPGISHLSLDKGAEKRILNFVTKPNIVNTTNEHVGEVREIVISNLANVQQPEEIKFKIKPHNLGLSGREPILASHSISELEVLDRKNKKLEKKAESTFISMNDLMNTLRSHDLDNIITSIEAAGLKKGGLEFRSVYRWPSAENKLIYGPEPNLPDSFTHFGTNGFWPTVFSIIAFLVQGAKHVASSALWQITSKDNEYGERVGVVGINHKRNNKIYYSENDFAPPQNVRLIESQAALLANAANNNLSITPSGVTYLPSASGKPKQAQSSSPTLASSGIAAQAVFRKTNGRS